MLSTHTEQTVPAGGEGAPGAVPLAALVLVGIPLAAVLVGQGALGRHLFLGASCLLGLYFFVRSAPDYFGFCIWLFLLAPWVRRLLDMDAGWLFVNHVLLAPYLVTSLSAFGLLAYLGRERNPSAGALVLILVALTYGLLLAVLEDRAKAAILETLRWALPWLFVGYVLSRDDQLEAFVRVVNKTFIAALPILGVYGIWQFVDPPLWDQIWMSNAPINSIGAPRPFEIRVFSTLNVPGSLAMALIAGLLFCSARPSLALLPGAALGLIALLLTVQRGSIFAFVVAICVLLIFGAARTRRAVVLLAGLFCTVALPVVLYVPEINEIMAERLETTIDLGNDISARARASQYQQFPALAEASMLGRGLGWDGRQGLLDSTETVVFDSTIIKAFVALGFLGGTAYFAGIFLCSYRVLRAALERPDPILHACAGITMVGLVLTVTWGGYTSEHGFFISLGIGIGLALVERAPD